MICDYLLKMNLIKLIEKIIEYYYIIQIFSDFLVPYYDMKNGIKDDDSTRIVKKWNDYPCEQNKNK